MDDYPAQVAMMKQNLRDKASPVITTGQVIRFGKILSILAKKLGKGKTVVTVLPDTAERYFSTPLFE